MRSFRRKLLRDTSPRSHGGVQGDRAWGEETRWKEQVGEWRGRRGDCVCRAVGLGAGRLLGGSSENRRVRARRIWSEGVFVLRCHEIVVVLGIAF